MHFPLYNFRGGLFCLLLVGRKVVADLLKAHEQRNDLRKLIALRHHSQGGFYFLDVIVPFLVAKLMRLDVWYGVIISAYSDSLVLSLDNPTFGCWVG